MRHLPPGHSPTRTSPSRLCAATTLFRRLCMQTPIGLRDILCLRSQEAKFIAFELRNGNRANQTRPSFFDYYILRPKREGKLPSHTVVHTGNNVVTVQGRRSVASEWQHCWTAREADVLLGFISVLSLMRRVHIMIHSVLCIHV